MARHDLTGQTFGRLTVLGYDHSDEKHTFWKCKCSCPMKTIVVVRADQLTSGHTKSCGCYHKDILREKLFNDLSGQTINGIKVINYEYTNKKQTYFRCICPYCGKEFITRGSSILNKHTRSCGCQSGGPTHGLHKHPLYKVYCNMVRRCYNPKHHAYKWYGGKGVYIASVWYTPGVPGNPGFVAFYNWAITHGYRKGLTIERKDVNGPYSPENCTWVDNKTQQNNKTSNMHINDGEEVLTYAQFEEKYKLITRFVSSRVETGWDLSAIVYAAKHPEKHVHIPRVSQKHKYPEGVYLNDEEFIVLIPKIPQPKETRIKRGPYKQKD